MTTQEQVPYKDPCPQCGEHLTTRWALGGMVYPPIGVTCEKCGYHRGWYDHVARKLLPIDPLPQGAFARYESQNSVTAVPDGKHWFQRLREKFVPKFSVRRTLAQLVGIRWPKRFGERWSLQEKRALHASIADIHALIFAEKQRLAEQAEQRTSKGET